MAAPLANFKEEFSSKIPALTLLTILGYTFIPPSQCETLRGNKFSQVILLPVLREYLARQRFPFASQQHALSTAAIDKIIHGRVQS